MRFLCPIAVCVTMWLHAWLIILVTLVDGSPLSPQPHPVVVETKGFKIHADDSLIATGLLPIKVNANLPIIESNDAPNLTSTDCNPITFKHCQLLDKIDNSSRAILQELISVLNVSTLSRTKRAILPFLADLRSFIEGTASEKRIKCSD